MKCATTFLLVMIGYFANAQSSDIVTNYGAVADGLEFYVNTTSGSDVITTSNGVPISSYYVGKQIMVCNTGRVNYGGTNQDSYSTITGIDSTGTNITLSQNMQTTCVNTFATCGTTNAYAFQAAYNAATGTNFIIYVPFEIGGNYTGKYWMPAPQHFGTSFVYYCMAGVVMPNGGVYWQGTGPTNPVLISGFGYEVYTNTITGRNDGEVYRGFLFISLASGAIGNNQGVEFIGLDLDGGAPQGYGFYGADRSQPANVLTGQGWDQTHDAFIDDSAFRNNFLEFTNCNFYGWRGEMVKSVGNATNGFELFTNCVFRDGNATAINLYAQQNVMNCLITNCWQGEEYYQQYNNSGLSMWNGVTLVTANTNTGANGIAFNGATGTNSPYLVENCTFILNNPTAGGAGVETQPGCNLIIQNNLFTSTNGSFGVSLGASGYQGSFCNSNIMVDNNIFSNVQPVLVQAGSSQNYLQSCTISGNQGLGNSQNFLETQNSTICTNVVYSNNYAPQERVNNNSTSSPWLTDGGGNTFTNWQSNIGGVLDYQASTCFGFLGNSPENYYLSTSDCQGPCQVGSTISVINNSGNGSVMNLQYQADSGNNPYGSVLKIPAGGTSRQFVWNGTSWNVVGFSLIFTH